MQNIKENFSKDTEMLKKNQTDFLEVKSSINQINHSVESSTVDWMKLKTDYQGLKRVDVLELLDE
jgi:hypothetical protein